MSPVSPARKRSTEPCMDLTEAMEGPGICPAVKGDDQASGMPEKAIKEQKLRQRDLLAVT